MFLFLQIINLGKSLTDLGAVTLKIDWPRRTEEDKSLLYLVAINSSGIDHIDCTPEQINPRKLVSGKNNNVWLFLSLIL